MLISFLRRSLEPGLPHLWQGVSMFFMGIVAALAVGGGFMRDHGFEEMIRRSVSRQTDGKAGFQTLAVMPDGRLRLTGFEHRKTGDGVEVGPLTAREAYLSVGLFSWPPAVKSVRLVGLGDVPVVIEPRALAVGKPSPLPEYPLSFEGADFHVAMRPLAPWPILGCSGSMEQTDRGFRAEFETSKLGEYAFPVRVNIDPGGRVRVDSGPIPLEGPGRFLLRALSAVVDLTGTIEVNDGSLVGWPVEKADFVLTLDKVGLRARADPLRPIWIHNGPQGVLSCHWRRGRLDFSFDEGPGSSWYFESGGKSWQFVSALRGSFRWDPPRAGEPLEIGFAQVRGEFAKGWALSASLETDPAGARVAQWHLSPPTPPIGRGPSPLWDIQGRWRVSPEAKGDVSKGDFQAQAQALGLAFALPGGGQAIVSGMFQCEGATERFRLPESVAWRLSEGHLVAGDPAGDGIELTGVTCRGTAAADFSRVELLGRVEGLRVTSGGQATDFSDERPTVHVTIVLPGFNGLAAGLPCPVSASLEAEGRWSVRLEREKGAGPAYRLTVKDLPVGLLIGREKLGPRVSWGPDSRCDAEARFVYDGERWNMEKRLRLRGIDIRDPQAGVHLKGVDLEFKR